MKIKGKAPRKHPRRYIEELALSILKNGLKTPIPVRINGKKLEMSDGFARFRALMALNRQLVPITLFINGIALNCFVEATVFEINT